MVFLTLSPFPPSFSCSLSRLGYFEPLQLTFVSLGPTYSLPSSFSLSAMKIRTSSSPSLFLSLQLSYRAWALNSWHSSCVNPSARALFHETDLSLSHVSVDDAAYIQQQHASWCQGERGRESVTTFSPPAALASISISKLCLFT